MYSLVLYVHTKSAFGCAEPCSCSASAKCRLGSAWIDPFAHCLSAFLKLSTSAFSFPDGLSVNRICVIAKVPPVILTLCVVATSVGGGAIS